MATAVMNETAAPSIALASRTNRLVAAIIDGVIVAAAAVPIMFMILMAVSIPALLLGLLGPVIGFAVFAGINYSLLSRDGQTIGKRIMKLRITDQAGQLLPVNDLLLKRYGVVYGVSAIPVLGSLLALVNVLLIFRSNQQCGHDQVAGTQVVNAE